jgi:hypothetical protein
MPLRDHFHPPWSEQRHWESFHSAWANTIVRQLSISLPLRYHAEPHTHLGFEVEVDVATFEEETTPAAEAAPGNGIATAVWAPPRPTQTLGVDFPAQDTFEVQVWDGQRGLHLVAAVELVSPRNKDRPASRRAFAVKCASYLQQGVSVVIVDIVTDRQQDLYAEMFEVLRLGPPVPWPVDPPLYAVACRTTKAGEHWQMDTWTEPLRLGSPLPTLPLWLASDLALPLELEAGYEETCRVLRMR